MLGKLIQRQDNLRDSLKCIINGTEPQPLSNKVDQEIIEQLERKVLAIQSQHSVEPTPRFVASLGKKLRSEGKDPQTLMIVEQDLESLKSMLDESKFAKIKQYLSSLDRLQE